VFFPLLLSSEHSGVLEDSNSQLFQVLGFTPTLGQSEVAIVDLGKMRPSNSEYACRVTVPVNKDGSRCFCGDYRPFNAQTRRDLFPMPLVEDVID
jgi:hypothetical protein